MEQPRAELRDQGLNNQFRRTLFSLALSYSALPWVAEAATGLEELNSQDRSRAASTKSQPADPRSVTLNLEPARDRPNFVPYKALGSKYSDDSARPVLSNTVVFTDELSILRAGIGMDLNLSELGNMHFNLYSPKGDINAGKRWNIGASDAQFPIVSKKIWSFGGTFDLARTHPGGSRTVVFIPQLMFNLDKVQGLGNKVQMTFQYENWQGSKSSNGNADNDRPVPQISIHWSF